MSCQYPSPPFSLLLFFWGIRIAAADPVLSMFPVHLSPLSHHSSTTTEQVCQDWSNREFTGKIQLNIVRMVEFLNKFGKSG